MALVRPALSQIVSHDSLLFKKDTIRHLRGETITKEDDREANDQLNITPVQLTVLRAQSIDRRSIPSTIGDALRTISSSLVLRNYGTLGGITLMSYRGLPSEYTIIYRDGIRITTEQNSLTDLGQYSPIGISEFDLLPASSALLLGGDAIGAAINLRPIDIPKEWSASIGSSVSSYDRLASANEREYHLRTGGPVADRLSVGFYGTSASSDGKFPFVQSFIGGETPAYEIIRENNDGHISQAGGVIDYGLAGYGDLRGVVDFNHSDRGVPGAATTFGRGATALDSRQRDNDLFTSIAWKNLRFGSVLLNMDGAYQREDEFYTQPSARIDDHYLNTLYQFDLRGESSLRENLEWYAGASLNLNPLQSNENQLSVGDSTITRKRAAIFSALRWTPSSELLALGALRVESVSAVGGTQLLPQLRLEYSPKEWLTLFSSYSRSFHAPTLNDLYWKVGGNPNLTFELGNNIEAGFLARYSSESNGFNLSLQSSLFDIFIDNEILWLPSPAGIYSPINVATANSRGVEINLDANYPRLMDKFGLHLHESYTLLRAQDRIADSIREIPYSTPSSSQFLLEITQEEIGSIAMTAEYRGHRFSDLGNTEIHRLPPVTIYNLTLSLAATHIWNLALRTRISIVNFTNISYQDVPFYPMPERTYRLAIDLDI